MNYAQMLGVAEHEFRLVFGRSKIEYDATKEGINRSKHHYSLESAVHILEGMLLAPWSNRPHAVKEVAPMNGEVRHEHLCVGDAGEVLFMVTTMRAPETVRVISLRPASAEEQNVFRKLTGYAPQ
jgi:uncharacterized DUF497 family protein